MDWNRMRDQIGWALTGVESYEHRQARLSEETPEQMHAAGPHCCDCDAVKYGYIHCCADHDPSRAILLDLIAELRRWPDMKCATDDGYGATLHGMADRAEVRMLEVSGD